MCSSKQPTAQTLIDAWGIEAEAKGLTAEEFAAQAAQHRQRAIAASLGDLVGTHHGSVTSFARALDVPVGTAWRWMRGYSLPPLDALVRIADLYGVSLDHLVGREAPPLGGLD